MSIEKITFQPFIGRDYEKQNRKILLLGESHYDSSGNCNDKENFTKEVVEDYINGATCRFFTCAIRAIFGEGATRDDYQKIAFYNYVQDFVGNSSRQKPKSVQWEYSKQPFLDVLKALKPDIIICCGQRLYNNTPDCPCGKIHKGEEICTERYLWCKKYCYHLENGKNIEMIAINHPSSVGFSGKNYYDEIINKL